MGSFRIRDPNLRLLHWQVNSSPLGPWKALLLSVFTRKDRDVHESNLTVPECLEHRRLASGSEAKAVQSEPLHFPRAALLGI